MSSAFLNRAEVMPLPHILCRLQTDEVLPKAMTDIAEETRAEVRTWLLRVKAATGWSWTKIARTAGVAPSTLTKAVKPDHPHAMSTTTLTKISRGTGVPMPPDLGAPATEGFTETEAAPYIPEGRPDIDRLLAEYTGDDANLVPWELATRALELAGYLPGDVVVLDMGATPRPGDIVCAQVYDFAHDTARTIWRRFDPPYLIPATTDPGAQKPEQLDRAKVKGVVVMSLRPRRAA